jgi:16S rRNA (guanine527-N7)-methyltransferase
MEQLVEQFIKEAEDAGIYLSEKVLNQIEEYKRILLKWSSLINLTTIKNPLDIYRYHFLESFYCASFIAEQGTLADVGSGAGFPGLAIKLMRPQLKVWLIEPRQKRAIFLKEVIRSLELKNVSVVQKRIEELMGGSMPEVNYITSRAVGKLANIVSWAHNILAEKGIIILLLSESSIEQLDKEDLQLIEKHKIPFRKEGIIALCRPKKDVSRETFSL